jgi:hypothetical protein
MCRRPPLLLVLLLALFLLSPSTALARRGFRPVFVGLGFTKLPGVPFDVIAASQVGPHLREYDAVPGLGRAARFSFVSNLVSAGLHTFSIGTMLAAGTQRRLDDEHATILACFTNAGADLGIAVLGLASGIDLVVRVKASDLQGTDPGIAAGWSGWVNIVMGSLGVIWFVPAIVVGLLAWNEVEEDLPEDEVPPDVAPRLSLLAGPGSVGFTLEF